MRAVIEWSSGVTRKLQHKEIKVITHKTGTLSKSEPVTGSEETAMLVINTL